MENIFTPRRKISKTALSILQKRYFMTGETRWRHVTSRIIDNVIPHFDEETKTLITEMIANRYFVPNSPCLVNAGKENGGLSACFVVDFPDTIEGIYKTKLDFALIAKKGGGCGTSLSKIRPENDAVAGSTHGFAGGPIRFANTISHDMNAMTQAGFRSMAIMFTMSVYHPDIIRFITTKSEEGKLANANISVVVDDKFMKAVENDEEFWTEFNGKKYHKYKATDVFNLITEGAWKNGEPGILFMDRIKDSPYKYTNQEIFSTNPCSEQPLPINGICTLGALDLSKFVSGQDMDYEKLKTATQLSVKFLDATISKSSFPTKDIEKWAKENRSIGLGIMGFADYCLMKKLAYGSEESIDELENILNIIQKIALEESENLGALLGVPKQCQLLDKPRRNITVTTIAPTGTTSLIAGCSSGIEPIFSEITIRNDKTGTYTFHNDLSSEPYFRCAVSSNGANEVSWEEHINILASAQKYIDSGVSKTINFPTMTRKETIAKAFVMAWELGCKGLAVYRNGSRKVEVLSPKNLKKDKCPTCGRELESLNGNKECTQCQLQIEIKDES